MRRPLLTAALLGAALLVLAALTALVLSWTTRAWFENDLRQRADLVEGAAADSLALSWRDPPALTRRLERLDLDHRVLGAAACDPFSGLVAQAGQLPAGFSCPNALTSLAEGGAGSRSWRAAVEGGPVLLSARAIEGTGGALVLVQDLGFAESRAGSASWIVLGGLFFFALAAAALTVVILRLQWTRWTAAVRDLATGHKERPEFRPVLRDVRELVARLSAENERDRQRAPWSPQRLRAELRQHLAGERILLLANREPYIHHRKDDGTVEVQHPASGLVTALEPVMRACSGVWVAHGSGNADRDSSDRKGRLEVPPEDPAYTLRRVWLSKEEEQGYYYGFANEGLWPLCHLADTRPTFRAADWEHYRAVNQRFADAVCEEADREDPVVLVQDYHFALAPRFIRARLPRATILSFWHIPFPNAERFGICPNRVELLEGMLGSSIIGFHTQLHCNNFFDSVDRFLESRIDREEDAVVHGGLRTLVRPYPISIEWPSQWSDSAPPPEQCRRNVLARFGLPPDALVGVGVDRLDYIKGIEERLLAVERALEKAPSLRGRLVFIQVAAPSRTAIDAYRLLAERVQACAQRINARFGQGNWKPVLLVPQHHEPPAVFELYRAADFVYVSSLHDGMNLVAKEFVASRTDERGVLLLSQFAGASRELTEALVVNPYDVDRAADALIAAVQMPAAEQRERMRAMRQYVSEFNVYRWAGRMVEDAARVRGRSRHPGREPEPARSTLLP